MIKKILAAALLVTWGSFLSPSAAIGGAEEGKKLFDSKKCIMCHSLGDQKGAMAQMGGALDGVGGKRDAEWLSAYLTDPKSKVENAKMPKQTLTDDEKKALVDYMLSLK